MSPELWRSGICVLLLCTACTLAPEALGCQGGAPAHGFICKDTEWQYIGDFNYTGPSGLVFGGKTRVIGNFYYQATSRTPVIFSYKSSLQVDGTAVFHDATAWKILLTPSQARDLWIHSSDRHVTYVQATKVTYNSYLVRTSSTDTCTVITGVAKTKNATYGALPVQLLVVEFVDFKSYVTCKIWWVIPLVIGVVLAIIGISLGCYCYGRNKHAEKMGYIPVSAPPNTVMEDNSQHHSVQYGSINDNPKDSADFVSN